MPLSLNATKHLQVSIEKIEQIAKKHNFKVLLHEKPFIGVNGSGKHNNWSLSTDSGENLLSPGKNPEKNLQIPPVLPHHVQTARGPC